MYVLAGHISFVSSFFKGFPCLSTFCIDKIPLSSVVTRRKSSEWLLIFDISFLAFDPAGAVLARCFSFLWDCSGTTNRSHQAFDFYSVH